MNEKLIIIKELTEKGFSTRQIEKVVGIGRTSLSKIIKENGFQKSKISVSDIQKQFLLGNIMGDGYIYRSTEGSKYRMNLAHSLKQKEYFLFKYEELKDLIKSDYKESCKLDKRTGKEYCEIRFQTRVNDIYTDLYKKWYRDGKKIMTKDLLEECGEIALAIKYFDDGSKTKSGYSIALNDYDDESIEAFACWLLEKFGIKSNIWSNKYVYINKANSEKFKEIISFVKCSDVQYKI